MILMYFSPIYATTQQTKLDSLEREVANSKEDTAAISTLNLLGNEWLNNGRFKKADSVAHLALALAEKLHYIKSRSQSYNLMGRIKMLQYDYPASRNYFFKAMKWEEKLHDTIGICKRLRNISITYNLENNNTQAILYAQKGLKIAESIKNYREMAGLHNAIAFVHFNNDDFSNALHHFQLALSFNKKNADNQILFACMNGIGLIHDTRADYDSSLFYNQQALKIAEEINDKNRIITCISAISVAYLNLGDPSKSMEYAFRGLKLAEEINNKREEAAFLSSISSCYEDLGDTSRFTSYLNKAMKIGQETQDEKVIGRSLHDMGRYYAIMNDIPQAVHYYQESIRLNKKVNATIILTGSLMNLGEIYLDKAQNDHNKDSCNNYYRLALRYLEEVLKNATKIGRKIQLVSGHLNIGKVYLLTHQLTLAETHLNKALSISIGIKEIAKRKLIHENLSQLYQEMGRTKEELIHFKNYITIRDSLNNLESHKKAIRSELNFEFEKKSAIEFAKQQRKDMLAAVESKRQRTILWFLIAIILIVILASAYIFYNYRQKQHTNAELSLRNQRIEIAHRIIEEKNHEITDSINYALHIQKAILPNEEKICRLLPQSFVLFKPKDIVSGDFYFCTIHHDKIYIAVADCTGHGVPGGFMSMIGSEKLNNAIKQSSDPGIILTLLNQSIKTSFQHADQEMLIQDGMDISLCAIDVKTNMVLFAGANRPLWIIRQSLGELEEIKGTLASIGGYTPDDKTFNTHMIQLAKGDTFYLFSDGYASQFGVNDKKITSKQFKKILSSIRDKPLKEQDQYLEDFCNNWKGSNEQTDDILVVGIRV